MSQTIAHMLDELSSTESKLREWAHWDGDEADHEVRRLERRRAELRQSIEAAHGIASPQEDGGTAA